MNERKSIFDSGLKINILSYFLRLKNDKGCFSYTEKQPDITDICQEYVSR